jgi:ADP-ribose pyrophosphatase
MVDASDDGPPRDRPEAWDVRSSQDVWRGDAPFSVRRDLVVAPDSDEEFGRLVLEHPGAVVVLAIDADGSALVLAQYRHPVGRVLVELPAGLLDVPGEDPIVTAQRELVEETGVRAARWTRLLSTYSSPGLSSELIHYFLAEELVEVPDRDGFELTHEEAHMTLHRVPVSDLVRSVVAGELADGPLVQAVLAYALREPARE